MMIIMVMKYGRNNENTICRFTSTVSINPNTVTAVTFQPNKVTSNVGKVTYTICDSSAVVTPRQIEVNTVASISNKKLGGTC